VAVLEYERARTPAPFLHRTQLSHRVILSAGRTFASEGLVEPKEPVATRVTANLTGVLSMLAETPTSLWRIP
jgi:hypothetical protein